MSNATATRRPRRRTATRTRRSAASAAAPTETLTPEATTPQTLNLTELLTAAATRVSDPAQLTPEEVLGLSSEEVRRLRLQARESASVTTTPTSLLNAWQSARKQIFVAPHATVLTGPSPRTTPATGRRMTEAISQVTETRGIKLLFEELNAGEDAPVVHNADVETSFFHLRFVHRSAVTGTARVGRRAAGVDPNTPAEGDRLVRVGTTVVAQLDANGAGAQLFTHPFLSGTQALTAAAVDGRKEMFGAILDAILTERALLPNIDAAAAATPNADLDAQRASAVATLDLLPGFIQAHSENLDTQRRNLTASRNELREQVNAARTQLMEQVRRCAEAERELAALDSAQGALSVARLTRALSDVSRIKERVGAVRFVELTNDNGTPAIKITLHPRVLNHGSRNYLIDNLVFTMRLDNNRRVTWQSCVDHDRSPHPHVSHQMATCWGEAELPLRQALERKDFASAVMHICGWASLYNHSSPYVRLNDGHFPTTTLEPGWYPDLPLGSLVS